MAAEKNPAEGSASHKDDAYNARRKKVDAAFSRVVEDPTISDAKREEIRKRTQRLRRKLTNAIDLTALDSEIQTYVQDIDTVVMPATAADTASIDSIPPPTADITIDTSDEPIPPISAEAQQAEAAEAQLIDANIAASRETSEDVHQVDDLPQTDAAGTEEPIPEVLKMIFDNDVPSYLAMQYNDLETEEEKLKFLSKWSAIKKDEDLDDDDDDDEGGEIDMHPVSSRRPFTKEELEQGPRIYLPTDPERLKLLQDKLIQYKQRAEEAHHNDMLEEGNKQFQKDSLDYDDELQYQTIILERLLKSGSEGVTRRQLAQEIDKKVIDEDDAFGADEEIFRDAYRIINDYVETGGKHLIKASPLEADKQPVTDTSVDTEDVTPVPDGTKDWRERWKGKLRGAAEKLALNERSEQLTIYLTQASEKLTEKAKEYGPEVAAFVGAQAERYNKLSWKKKLLVAGALMGGVSLTSSSLPIVSGILAGALYGQRALGAIGFAMNRRKKIDVEIAKNPYHWLRNKSEAQKNVYATALAAAYMAGGSLAVHGGVEGLNALGVNEWLGNMMGHPSQPHAPSVEPSKPITVPHTAPEANAPMPSDSSAPAAVPAAEAPAETPQAASAPATNPEVDAAATPATPDISIEASKGHGAEWMMKRLWELAAERGLDANSFPEDSDMHKLLEADAGNIDKIVHQIAMDPKHEFFQGGESVGISLDSHMTVNSAGNVEIDGMIAAPEVETPAVPDATSPETATETPQPTSPEPQQPTTDSPPYEPVEKPVSHVPPAPHPTHEAGHLVADAVPDSVKNHLGVEVAFNKAHVYEGPSVEKIVFGGTPEQQQETIFAYLNKNPYAVIHAPDAENQFCIPWYNVAGDIFAGDPIKQDGFWFLKTWAPPPGPEDCEKLIT